MEGIMRKHELSTKTRPTRPLSTSSSSGGTLSMHKDSRTIGKLGKAPKIRVIHIFAPEIIKTDVANFRELVQRLTGKPTVGDQKNACKLPAARSTLVMKKSSRRKVDEEPVVVAAAVAKKCTGLSRIKDEDEEEEMWGGGGNFLGGLEEYYGLMQETHYNINGFLNHPPFLDDLHSFGC